MNGYYAVDEWFKFADTFKPFFPLSAQKCFNISSTGNIPPSKAGVTLAHEHLLVDFIGTENYSHSRWKEDDAYLAAMQKLLLRLSKAGNSTISLDGVNEENIQ